jgi:ATP-dependent Clp protease adaptor protein ClpS
MKKSVPRFRAVHSLHSVMGTSSAGGSEEGGNIRLSGPVPGGVRVEGRFVSKRLPEGDTKVVEESRSKTARPPLFKVLMHNDDYTTMEFVIEVLESVFHKSPPEATQIMLNIHLKGVGLCGVYPFEIAETKVDRVHAVARSEGFPLKCSLEEA